MSSSFGADPEKVIEVKPEKVKDFGERVRTVGADLLTAAFDASGMISSVNLNLDTEVDIPVLGLLQTRLTEDYAKLSGAGAPEGASGLGPDAATSALIGGFAATLFGGVLERVDDINATAIDKVFDAPPEQRTATFPAADLTRMGLMKPSPSGSQTQSAPVPRPIYEYDESTILPAIFFGGEPKPVRVLGYDMNGDGLIKEEDGDLPAPPPGTEPEDTAGDRDGFRMLTPEERGKLGDVVEPEQYLDPASLKPKEWTPPWEGLAEGFSNFRAH